MKRLFWILVVCSMIYAAGCSAPAPVQESLPPAPASSISVEPAADASQAPAGPEEVQNRHMTLTFAFGERTGKYTGTMEDGKPQGEGAFLYYFEANGKQCKRLYEGSWQAGHWDGMGKMYYEDVLHFEGKWEKDVQIEGKTYRNDGSLWMDGVYDGLGYLRTGKLYEDGVLRCEGTFNGEYLVQGKLYDWKGTLSYEGELDYSIPQGHGIAYFDGYTFEGTFEKGSGKEGTVTYANGVKYIGTLKNGSQRHGYGKQIDEKGITRYEGEFQNDLVHGYGKLYDENGKLLYEGEFKNGEIAGGKDKGQKAEPDRAPETIQASYSAGEYLVGTDIPAGEYYLDARGQRCYYEVTKDSSGDLESIVENGNTTSTVYITVEDGQYFSFKRGKVVPAESRKTDIQTELKAGMYKVGVDIQPGEYKLTAGEDKAYVAVYKTTKASSGIRAIRTNDNFTGNKYQKVKDGEYLLLKRCTAEFVK